MGSVGGGVSSVLLRIWFVNATRWSTAMIKWAKFNGIMQGYSDGTFRPTQTVTRAELMAVLRKAIQYALEGGGISGMRSSSMRFVNSSIALIDWG